MTITRRDLLRSAAAGSLARPVAGQHGTPGKPPNIVFILADDLGYGDLSCYGATKVQTPNCDRIAKEGMLFTDAHSPSAVCSPTRYGLLTGRYCWRNPRHPPEGVLSPAAPLIIEEGRTTVPSLLKAAGYATGCVGKWHLGFGVEPGANFNGELKPGPLEIGFDHFYGEPGNRFGRFYIENHRVVRLDAADPLVWVSKPRPVGTTAQVIEGGKSARTMKDPDNTLVLTGKAVRFIEDNAERPFFLYYAPNNVHVAITPNAKFHGASQCGLYGDFIAELDWSVGEILQTLDRLKLSNNTLIVFTSDNGGGYYKPHNSRAFAQGHRINGPLLLGQKADIWEGGHRVPFLAHWPGRIRAASRSSQLLCLTDVLATCAEITGQQLTSEAAPDSYSFLPTLLGRKPRGPVRDAVVLHSYRGVFAIRQREWILIQAQGCGGLTLNPQRDTMDFAELRFRNSDYTPEGKLKPGAPPAQLYNLAKDISQSTNVYRQHPDIVKRLTALLEKYKKEGRSRPEGRHS